MRDPETTEDDVKTNIAIEKACIASGHNFDSMLLSIAMYADR
jgi:hypothetical protein